jgi:hypothetical protein
MSSLRVAISNLNVLRAAAILVSAVCLAISAPNLAIHINFLFLETHSLIFISLPLPPTATATGSDLSVLELPRPRPPLPVCIVPLHTSVPVGARSVAGKPPPCPRSSES